MCNDTFDDVYDFIDKPFDDKSFKEQFKILKDKSHDLYQNINKTRKSKKRVNLKHTQSQIQDLNRHLLILNKEYPKLVRTNLDAKVTGFDQGYREALRDMKNYSV